MRVEDSALLAQEMDDFDWIATLPEKMAEVVICADFLADSFAQLNERSRIVDNEIRMHLQSEALDAVVAGVFCRFFPIGNDFFFPLPVLHLGVLRGPTVGDPVRLRVLRR